MSDVSKTKNPWEKGTQLSRLLYERKRLIEEIGEICVQRHIKKKADYGLTPKIERVIKIDKLTKPIVDEMRGDIGKRGASVDWGRLESPPASTPVLRKRPEKAKD